MSPLTIGLGYLAVHVVLSKVLWKVGKADRRDVKRFGGDLIGRIR